MHRLLFAATLILSLPSAHALSCHGRLIENGDSSVRVRSLCGEPAEIRSRVEQRSRAVYGRGPGFGVTDIVTVTITIEQWTYDFGPQRFMQQLTFEEGQLLTVRELGYGTPNGRSAQAPRIVRDRLALFDRRISVAPSST